MFDFHIHSRVSFDSKEDPIQIALTAKEKGLREICFTDHYDHNSEKNFLHRLFTKDVYDKEYAALSVPGITLRRGVEFSLTDWNVPELRALSMEFDFDFVIGSVHFVNGYDPYGQDYWVGETQHTGFVRYLDRVLECVKIHSEFDVLGHLNYVCKSAHNPLHTPLYYKDYREVSDAIMAELAKKGRGMEINTSGIDRVGFPLPNAEFLKRFRELGGEIITVGSDAHDHTRVGQYVPEMLEIIKDIFGYVCTFEKRVPIFHKL